MGQSRTSTVSWSDVAALLDAIDQLHSSSTALMFKHDGGSARDLWVVSVLSVWPILLDDLSPLMLLTQDTFVGVSEIGFVARVFQLLHRHDGGIGKMYRQSGLFPPGGLLEEKTR